MFKSSQENTIAWAFKFCAFLAVFLSSHVAHAQKIGDLLGKESITNRPLILLVSLGVLTLIPFVLIMVTSFVKIAVVLSVVRQAIGTQQIPPTQVITGLAIILTIYIMAPVGLEMYHNSSDILGKKGLSKIAWADFTVGQLQKMGQQAQHPIRNFLIRHAHVREQSMFFKLAWKMRQPRDRANLKDDDFIVIVPAFVISELKEAFQIGFILFVPFLVIDMVVANILMAFGHADALTNHNFIAL